MTSSRCIAKRRASPSSTIRSATGRVPSPSLPPRPQEFAEGCIAEGLIADLVLFRARTFNELLARPSQDRIVLRNGKAIERALPDYRELDYLMEHS